MPTQSELGRSAAGQPFCALYTKEIKVTQNIVTVLININSEQICMVSPEKVESKVQPKSFCFGFYISITKFKMMSSFLHMQINIAKK